MLHKLVAMFCPLDEKGVINILKPQPGWWERTEMMARIPNFSINRLARTGLIGDPMAALYMFIIFILEEEIGMLKGELSTA